MHGHSAMLKRLAAVCWLSLSMLLGCASSPATTSLPSVNARHQLGPGDTFEVASRRGDLRARSRRRRRVDQLSARGTSWSRGAVCRIATAFEARFSSEAAARSALSVFLLSKPRHRSRSCGGDEAGRLSADARHDDHSSDQRRGRAHGVASGDNTIGLARRGQLQRFLVPSMGSPKAASRTSRSRRRYRLRPNASSDRLSCRFLAARAAGYVS